MPTCQTLSLTDLILNRPVSITFHRSSLFGIDLRLFFRRIETSMLSLPIGTAAFCNESPNG